MANLFHIRLKRAGAASYESTILMELRQLDGRVPVVGQTIDVPFMGQSVRAIVRAVFSVPSRDGKAVHTVTVDEAV